MRDYPSVTGFAGATSPFVLRKNGEDLERTWPSLQVVILNLFQDPFLHIIRSVRGRDKQPCVYILASGHYGTLYIGVTSDLLGRMWQHREGKLPGFTARHTVHRLVHFELFGQMDLAISREKQLKRWHRPWKINLINAANPEWRDLAVGLGLPPLAPRERKHGS